MARMKLTKRAVDALAVATRATGERYYDTETRGFGISAFPSGQKVFFIEYGPERRRRRMRLGPFGTLTVEQAREEARQKLADVVKGHDPLEEKEKHRAMPLFKKWVEDYLVDLPLRKKRFDQDVYYLQGTKPGRKRSGKGAKGNLEDKRRKPRQSEAMERWGSRPLDSITRGEVEGLLAHVAETRGTTTANRCYASLRACFEAAVRVGVLSSNPAVYVRKYRESEPRARVLSDDELKKVREAVDALPDASVRMAFYLLIDTGARKSEVLRARRSDFDLDAGSWRLPSPKAGHPQVIPLPPTIIARLRNLPQMSEWLVPGRFGKHRADLRNEWDAIRTAASLTDVNIHDLRRTFGLEATRTLGLNVASKLLRHSDPRITAHVYAPEEFPELRKATEAISKKRAAVLPFPASGQGR